MPAPFQPKFVDLVRNFTTTQGTGNFVLGAAVAGYSSLASAIATGERFYYCAMGVDKPAEREVGRGTMMANGTVAREPISGPPINFSNGQKSIALVVAADWFDAMARGDGGGLTLAFTSAAGAAIGETATGLETVGYSAPGIGAARYVYDAAINSVFVAAHPAWSFLVADGRGFRLAEDVLQLEHFGAVPGDYSSGAGADCLPAWNAAMDYLDFYPRNVGSVSVIYEGAREIVFPGAQYFFSDTLNLKRTLRLTGMGGSFFGGDATILRWPVGKAGIVVNSYNTLGSGVEDPYTTSASGSIIRGFKLRGGFAGAEGEYHGIRLRARGAIEDCAIENFAGDGVHIWASSGAGGATEGNANNWSINRCRTAGCRDGLFVSGGDANAGMATALDSSANRRWGINDRSFLGNTYIGCHSADNGIVAGQPSATIVAHGGNRFYVKDGEAAGASINAPPVTPTDNAWWGFAYAGGVSAPIVPAWVSGIAVREGGAYRTNNLNASNLFLGCYSEGGQAPAQYTTPTLVVGGLLGAGTRGTGVHLSNHQGRLSSPKSIRTESTFLAEGSGSSFGPSGTAPASDNIIYVDCTNFGNTIQFRSWLDNVGVEDGFIASVRGVGMLWNGSNNHIFRIANVTAAVLTPTGLDVTGAVGGASLKLSGKQILSGTAAPVGGAYARGDMVFNSAPSAGGPPGWMCVTAGSPGTWKAMANLAA